MRRVILLSIWALLWGALPVSAQGTRADTVLATTMKATVTDSLRLEAGRKQGIRKTVVIRLAGRADSLTKAHLGPTNRPPVALFTYPAAGCKVGDICTFDASASTDDKAVVSYQWDCGVTPNCASTGKTASAVYTVAGTPLVTLRVTDSEGLSSTTQRSIPIVAPIIPPDTVTPPPDSGFTKAPALPAREASVMFAKATRTIVVTTDLQGALNAAQPGDSLVLSGTFTGHFVLPARPCGAGITITSAGVIPPAGTRVTPTSAVGLAKIIATDYGPTIATSAGTCGWRLVGLEVVAAFESATTMSYGIVKLGAGGDEGQTTLATVPTDIVLERVYVHGTAGHNDARCIVLNSANTVIRDSWISECHAKGFDSQAIEGWNGPGPYLIQNNYLAGAGENVMFGGADPGIVGLSPSDITLRGNHVTKPVTWRGVWTAKNLFELKNARRVLVENNVFENNWIDGQSGMAIVIKSSQDACGTCTWQGTTDVTFRWNIVRNSPRGFNAQAVDCSGQACVDVHVQRVRVENNLFENIGAEGDAWLALLTHDLKDIALLNNTFTHAPGVGTTRGAAVMMDYGAGAAQRIDIRGNVFTAGAYEVFYSGGFIGSAALAQLAGSSYRFTNNAIVGGQFASKYPPGNTYPGTVPLTPGVDRAELLRRTAAVVISP